MFYAIQNKTILETQLEQLDGATPSFGYLDMEQIAQGNLPPTLRPQELMDYLADPSHLRTSIDVYDDCSIVFIHVASLDEMVCKCDQIALVIRKNQFLVIRMEDEDDSTMHALENAVRRFRENATLEKIIFGTLNTLLGNGSTDLEQYEQRIMKMEERLVFGETDQKLNQDIFEMRNQLTELHYYYEQLVDVGETLEQNENNLFREKDLRYIRIFAEKAQRLSNKTQALGESLIHLREALDAAMNYSMNRIMKVFTVVSVIFLPLTLITGWYGMNFSYMPELAWEYSYPVVAGLCVVVVSICLLYFRKKKWL